MLKKFILPLFVLLAVSLAAQAQMNLPATWTYTFAAPPKAGLVTELIFTAKIPAGWYMYSNDFEDIGPIQISFTFTPNASYTLIGKSRPVNPKRKKDEVWDGEISYFEGKAEFRQKIKFLNNKPVVKGEIEYQLCSNKEGKCVLFTDDFDFNVISGKGGRFSDEKLAVDKPDQLLNAASRLPEHGSLSLFIYYSILQFLNKL